MACTQCVTLLTARLANVKSGDTPVNKYTHCTSSSNDDSSRPRSTCSTIRTSPGPAAPFSRKRKRTESLEDQSSCVSEPGIILPEASEKKHASSGFVGIRPPPLVYPRSLYTGHQPPFPRTKERHVLDEILVSYTWYGWSVQPLILVLGGRSNSVSLR